MSLTSHIKMKNLEQENKMLKQEVLELKRVIESLNDAKENLAYELREKAEKAQE